MPLVTCPDCSKEVSELASACIHCGRPMTVQSAGAPASAPAANAPVSARRLVVSVLIVVAVLAALAYGYIATGVGAKIDASCMLNGFGTGTCEFPNTGWTPGQQCCVVKIVNNYGSSADSDEVCSGTVWPGQASERKVGVRMPKDHCKADFMNNETWTDVCRIEVVDRP